MDKFPVIANPPKLKQDRWDHFNRPEHQGDLTTN